MKKDAIAILRGIGVCLLLAVPLAAGEAVPEPPFQELIVLMMGSSIFAHTGFLTAVFRISLAELHAMERESFAQWREEALEVLRNRAARE